MKTLAFAFAFLSMFSVMGRTQPIKQNGESSSSISKSSVTIPSFGANRIVTTGAGGVLVTYSTFSLTGAGVLSAADAAFSGSVTASSVTSLGGSASVIPGLAHGITDILPTDEFFRVSKEAASGGANIYGVGTNSTATGPLRFNGIFGETDPTDTVPGILLNAQKKSGTSWTSLGNSETVFQFKSGASTFMTGLGNGSVGIGTASPCSTCTLHVAGGASVVGGLGFGTRTKAQFDAANGVSEQAWLCSDCVIPYSLCVGTGTTLSGWKVSHSATVGCGTNN